MATRRQALLAGTSVHLWRQQDMHDVRPCFSKHGVKAAKHCGNPIFLLNCLGAIQVDVAHGDRLDEFGDRLKSGSVTFRDVSCAKESDAESLVWSYLA
jgi:hypothetical protein